MQKVSEQTKKRKTGLVLRFFVCEKLRKKCEKERLYERKSKRIGKNQNFIPYLEIGIADDYFNGTSGNI